MQPWAMLLFFPKVSGIPLKKNHWNPPILRSPSLKGLTWNASNDTPWKFNIAPENVPFQQESSLPTIFFRGYVKLREGIQKMVSPFRGSHFQLPGSTAFCRFFRFLRQREAIEHLGFSHAEANQFRELFILADKALGLGYMVIW